MRKSLNKLVDFSACHVGLLAGIYQLKDFGWYDWIGSSNSMAIYSYLVVECEHIPYLKRCNIIKIVAYGRFR